MRRLVQSPLGFSERPDFDRCHSSHFAQSLIIFNTSHGEHRQPCQFCPHLFKQDPSSQDIGEQGWISADLLCETVMQVIFEYRSTMETEGVGFEPTVGFPTLDFESSALNRTQPPFRSEKENAERPTSNAERNRLLNCDTGHWLFASALQGSQHPTGLRLSTGRTLYKVNRMRPAQRFIQAKKNVTIFSLPRVRNVLHLVCPHGRPRYYLLLTRVHRLLAPLFTSICNLFETSTPPSPP
jgi:hypothetical protein